VRGLNAVQTGKVVSLSTCLFSQGRKSLTKATQGLASVIAVEEPSPTGKPFTGTTSLTAS